MKNMIIALHPYHLVNPSPWPLLSSIGAFGLTIGAVMGFHLYLKSSLVFFLALFTLLLTSGLWWRDVIREGTFEGCHTKAVQTNLKIGMILFIVSEVMFFSGFFWAFFHSSLAPAIELGSVWPPMGIEIFRAWDIPLLNTLVLLLSGATLTWSHFSLLLVNYTETLVSVIITILLAIFFTILQLSEYTESSFTISDGVYGSTFFMATGFHGFHVIVGTIFILITALRYKMLHFSSKHHLGFESASWYWHFVDVVWLFLFITIYWWGNTIVFNPFLDYIFFNNLS